MANVGHAQVRKDKVVEPPLVTVGDDLNTVATFLAPGRDSYSAADVVKSLMRLVPKEEEAAEPIAAMSTVPTLQQVLSLEPFLAPA